jgi:hypothetical protein
LLCLVSILSILRKGNLLLDSIYRWSNPSLLTASNPLFTEFSSSLSSILEQVLSLVNLICDDVFFLSLAFPANRLSLSIRRRADFYADFSWLALSLLALWRVQQSRESLLGRFAQLQLLSEDVNAEEGDAEAAAASMTRITASMRELWWERIRLSADAIFAGASVRSRYS